MVKTASSSASSPISCVELCEKEEKSIFGFPAGLRFQVGTSWEGRENATVTRQNIKLKMTHARIRLFNYNHLCDPALLFFFFLASLWLIRCKSCTQNKSLLTELAGYHWHYSTCFSLHRTLERAAGCRYESSVGYGVFTLERLSNTAQRQERTRQCWKPDLHPFQSHARQKSQHLETREATLITKILRLPVFPVSC